MFVFTALYNILIKPLELLFEIVFSLANRVIGNPALSIIFLSLAVNFLVLPLYKQADAMQAEERATEERLRHWVKHIKKTFKGDERMMMLQTYYRQNNYKPTDALKGSMSLMLEIPFFIAAYHFLSNLGLLQGVQFGPIADLGKPDAMFVVAGFTVNVLPILMTLINVISGAIYSAGGSLKSKIQIYGMALIFLVFLYDSPSGLVFYWTLNNVFSLVKNVFYKLKKPQLVLSIMASMAGIAGVVALLVIRPEFSTRKQVLLLGALLLLQLPIVLYAVTKRTKMQLQVTATKTDSVIFHVGCLFLTILTGLLIPSGVISSSAAEFVDRVSNVSPLIYVWNVATVAFGTFVVWFGVFHMLAKPMGKKLMSMGVWLLSGVAVVDYMFFGTGYGNLSIDLQYDVLPDFALKQQLINFAVILVVALVLFVLWKKKTEAVKFIYLAACLAGIGMSVVNIVSIQTVSAETIANLEENQSSTPNIPLSKNGQNVVVIMLDRAISSYVPYMLEEKPELKEQFQGFTYYPNTLSYGGSTNFASPCLYGGYDYVPEELNKRDEEPLADKHNEALKVMPVLFDQNDYQVTVCDPTYAGYQWIPDLSIYDEYPDINTYITMGKYQTFQAQTQEEREAKMTRNFFCYSLFKIAPVVCQPTLYNAGEYNRLDSQVLASPQQREGVVKSQGVQEAFMNSYGVLTNLSQISEVSDSSENTFMMISNDTTHEPMLLQLPNYEPAPVVDNTDYQELYDARVVDGKKLEFKTESHIIHYQANMAAFLQIGKWLDYLREQGVYDNTRIILVSDHGSRQHQFDDMVLWEGEDDIMGYNPLLMVKDFNSQEFTVDEAFMTNADVPTLATQGLLQNAQNPFTGNPIYQEEVKDQPQHVIMSEEWNVSKNNGNTFLKSQWASVNNGNIFDRNNWTLLGEK